MNPTTLKFFIKEDDRDFPVCDMTEPESAAISECLDDLLPQTYTTNYWFEVDTCLFDEDDDDQEPVYGLVRCFTHHPIPKNGSVLENRLPYPIPQTVLDSLAGKTFRIHPRQLGLSPWGVKIEVTFASVSAERQPPLSAPIVPALAKLPEILQAISADVSIPTAMKTGIRASDLIAAALKAQ